MAEGYENQTWNNSAWDNSTKIGYCKMPDGTLICWGHATLNSIPAESFTTEVSAVFPIPFIIAPSVTATVHKWTDPSIFAVCIKDLSTTSVQIRVRNNTSYEQTDVGLLWQAIGRWK